MSKLKIVRVVAITEALWADEAGRFRASGFRPYYLDAGEYFKGGRWIDRKAVIVRLAGPGEPPIQGHDAYIPKNALLARPPRPAPRYAIRGKEEVLAGGVGRKLLTI